LNPTIALSAGASRAMSDEPETDWSEWSAAVEHGLVATHSSSISEVEPRWCTPSTSVSLGGAPTVDLIRLTWCQASRKSVGHNGQSRLAMLLRAWRAGDATEQKETFGYLREAMDRDRMSDRRLFD
jgi:hypothetical protein